MERGGPTTQSGILYQNSIAALYLGRLCDSTQRPDKYAVEAVRIEAPSAVDDIVVTHRDGHRAFIQAKENIRDNDEAWQGLWKAFENQFWNADFRIEKDRLLLHVGEIHDEHHALREITNRASSSETHSEWLLRLTKPQEKLLRKITAIFDPKHSEAEEVLSLFKHVDVEIHPLIDFERDLAPKWIPASNKKPIELFRLLRDAAANAARKRGSFSSTDLRAQLAAECNVTFVQQPDTDELLEVVKACGATLKQHKNAFGSTGRHLTRPIVNIITGWIQDTGERDDVGILVDRAGMGKTVVLQDVLYNLESAGINVLAIKADLLSGITTVDDLRLHLRLPDTVERILQRLAALSPAVLLIDQIDALSRSLARDQRTLDLVLDLVARARIISGVRVLLSCRTFDLNNSPKLSNLKSKKFEVTELEETEVRLVLETAPHPTHYDQLSPATRRLLRVPLHLDLFLRVLDERTTEKSAGTATAHAIQSLQDLYAALWQTVIRKHDSDAPPVADRELVLQVITDEMDLTKRTTVSQSLMSIQSPNMERAAQWLASQGILVPNRVHSGLEWAFLHQTFFDYCYAKNFLGERKSLFEIVRDGDQGLFARPQVIHVLEFLRGVDPPQYIRELSKFLNAPASQLRFHLRDHVLRWFGSILNPTEDEWLIAKRLLADENRRSAFLIVAQGNMGWFDRLKGDLQKDLDSEIDEVIDKETIPFIYSMVNANQSEIITFLRPYQQKNNKWKTRVQNITRHIRDWKSEEAIALFEERFREAPVERLGDFYEIHEIAKTDPRAACRLIRIAFDRILDDQISTRTGDGEFHLYSLRLPAALEVLNGSTITEALGNVTKAYPKYFLDTMLPWLERVVRIKPPRNDPFSFANDSLAESWYSSHYVVHHEINEAFIKALTSLGQTSKTQFAEIAQKLESLPYCAPQRYLAHAYRNLVASMTEDAFNFLISDRRRLDLGDHQQYDSRQLIKVIIPNLTNEQLVLLESAILSYVPLKKYHGIGALRWRGLEKLFLLQCLPPERLTAEGRKQLRELERKFPGIQASEDPGTAREGFVGPPIPDDVAQKMSDKSWLRAMTKYKGNFQHKHFLKGGASEQGAVLSRLTKESPERFFKLAMRAPLDTDEAYVRGLIAGLSQSSAPAELAFDLIRRFVPVATSDTKRAIAWALEKRVDDGIPDDLIAVMDEYMREGPGEDESWWLQEAEMNRRNGRQGDVHGGPHSSYLNSVRGAAMRTLMRAFNHRADVAAKWQLIERAAVDESVAIKAGAIEELFYVLEDDRPRALSIFDSLMEGQPALLGAHFTDDFIYYGFFKNYLRMKPYIVAMMNDASENVQQRGAELACIAAISPKAMESQAAEIAAQSLAQETLTGSSPWRRGAARVYGQNASRGAEDCADRLTELVNDDDEEVRKYVSGCFHSLRAEDFFSMRPFIEAFASSRSLETGLHDFTDFLWENGPVDPTWALTIVETVLNNPHSSKSEINLGGGEELVRLVLRVYTDPTVEFSTRERAMDLFDRLMQVSLRSAQRVLAEWDRS